MPLPSATANASQIEFWNSAVGHTWVELQSELDAQNAPLGAAAIEALGLEEGESVLDVGCGCGATTLALAARVGPSGHVLGVDVSRPMLAVARRRAQRAGPPGVEFRELDAQCGPLGAAPFDAVFSRFGVMFFNDPVAAFAHLRESLRPRGRLAFVCWRSLEENPWLREPLEAARPSLPPLPPSDPHAPGPFAFADPQRVRTILEQAGFDAVILEPFDACIGAGDLEQTLRRSLRLGPLGAALREYPEYESRVQEAIRALLRSHEHAGAVRLGAAVWVVRALAPERNAPGPRR